MTYLKLAIRNVRKQARRSALMGSALFLSFLVLVLGLAFANGSGRATLRRHYEAQSGDVVVLWDSVRDYDSSDAGRILFSQFNPKRGGVAPARRALDAQTSRAAVVRYLGQHAQEVRDVRPSIRSFGMIDTGSSLLYALLQGLTEQEMVFLAGRSHLELWRGVDLLAQQNGFYVTEAFARKNDLRLGDRVWMDATTLDGLGNSLPFVVAGILKNGAPWDDLWVYCRDEDLRRLVECDATYWSSLRVFLKDPQEATAFAQGLNRELEASVAGPAVMLAEPHEVSARIWASLGAIQKGLFVLFTGVLLGVIAIGMRSAVRLALFERTREMGTLRAVGFGRFAVFVLVFLEVLCLSTLAWLLAVAVGAVVVLISSATGIYMGSGQAAYLVGEEIVRPRFAATDFALQILAVAAFSLFAVLKPGLRLGRQSVTDLLGGRQRSFSALLDVGRAVLKGARTRRNGPTAINARSLV